MISLLPILSDIGAPVMPGGSELAPFAPELVLVATIVGVLLTPFFTKRSNAAAALVSLAGLILALVSLIWAKDAGLGERFIPMLINDHYAVLWKLMLFIFTIGVIQAAGVGDRVWPGPGAEEVCVRGAAHDSSASSAGTGSQDTVDGRRAARGFG